MNHLFRILTAFFLLAILVGCNSAQALPKELIYRDWEGAVPPEVFTAFTKETGIKVVYKTYSDQEAVVADIKAGKVFDVVVLENQLIQGAVKEKLLAEIDYKNVSNFKNISANFRDMAYDPRNLHSVPYSWGSTGLVVRTDLAGASITSWADLWNPRYAGKITGWILPRYMIGISLKSLGYSVNSEKPEELALALRHLLELKPNIHLLEWQSAVSAPYLIRGDAILAVGQADDLLAAQEQNSNVSYVMPSEGGILWGDNWTIPANSPNKAAAEALINFLLRPEISAKIINESHYWLPNDAALPLVNPAIRNNLAVFPSADSVKKAEILLPLSSDGDVLYQKIWEEFLKAGGS
jgi:spermidine/putrescine transport system substrate-binding protein